MPPMVLEMRPFFHAIYGNGGVFAGIARQSRRTFVVTQRCVLVPVVGATLSSPREAEL